VDLHSGDLSHAVLPFPQGEIVRHHGYPYEEHEVETDDGYFLTLQRIPHPPKAVVLLQHGLVLEGSNWVTNLPNSSLGFILADAGYDVWIGNSRGNSWSRKHKEFEFYQQEYSAYSFHEMAMYDLPATINYILQKTGQEQLYYVAYSQGTTTGFIAFSSLPELDRKIKMFFALAPITVNSHMKSPLVRVFDLPEVLIKLILGHRVVFDKDEVLKQVISRMCVYPILKSLCTLVFYLPGGFTNSLNVFLCHPLGLGTNSKQQSGSTLNFHSAPDLPLVFQTTPPFYELEKMQTPLAAWYGGKDWISAPEDVNITLPRISNVAYKKYIPEFVHFDFLWGKQVYEQVYKEMLDLMEKSA
uniref:Partial AB-hydrolase lipase domain-containing protein n=1 Tax=Malurus cyaneus samueli TaxID=2593467 RepID=A0A8C5U4J4_9PASS